MQADFPGSAAEEQREPSTTRDSRNAGVSFRHCHWRGPQVQNGESEAQLSGDSARAPDHPECPQTSSKKDIRSKFRLFSLYARSGWSSVNVAAIEQALNSTISRQTVTQ